MDSSARRMRGNSESLFRGGDLLIDLGCGDGSWLDEIAPRYEKAFGADIVDTRADRPASRPRTWEFIKADLDLGLPFDDGIATAIRANQVIEHVREPAAFLAGAHRVLQPGGLLVITTPNIRYVRHLARLVIQGRGPMTSAHLPGETAMWDDGHLHYLTPGDLRRIAREAGFKQVRVSALVERSGRFGALRQVLARLSDTAPVREFLSGNMILVARR